ncbi:MAG: glycosyltransferase family 4 protein [Desulfuromonadales bacterium]|nr:glycosyltransferase family 4 protein [Desulfuromonadales bacterium]
MKVGIDCRSLLAAKTGIGVYTDRLLHGLAECSGLKLKCYLHLPFLNPNKIRRALTEVAQAHQRVEIVSQSFPTPKIQRLIWSYTDFMPVETIIGDVDIFHSTSFLMPPLRKAKGVLTIYDLTFMLFPEYHLTEMQAYTRHIRKYAERADCIIAISDHTKRDIVEQLDFPDERIRVTMLAADERYHIVNDPDAISSVKSKFGIDGDYILYTGTLEPRKNIPTLIRAYALLRNERKITHRLVLAGKKGWLYKEILESVRTLGLERDVIFTGFVADEDMPYLYNGAELFVYPSFYEGFGLPPLEAMACGCPVVTSNTSSLPEVVGNAGLMVDPNRPEELAEAMGRILEDSELRAKLREKGLRRSAEFSWKRCAEETLAVYRELSGKGNVG